MKMNFQILLLSIILSSTLNVLFGQKNDNHWTFGLNSKSGDPGFGTGLIAFSQNEVQIDTFSSPINFQESVCSMSDSSGNLLFYTNGVDIINAAGQLMENGGNINQFGTYTQFAKHVGLNFDQSYLSIPVPDMSDSYYLFYLEHYSKYVNSGFSTGIHARKLKYSLIDTKANNQSGKIIEKDKDIFSGDLDGLTATKHGNGKDWWIVMPSDTGGLYHVVLVDAFGIHYKTPKQVYSEWGSEPVHLGFRDKGWNVFSPDGTKFINFQPRLNRFWIMDFDRCTGHFTNPEKIEVEYFTEPNFLQGFYWHFPGNGAAISPSGRFLYISNFRAIIQFDLEASDVLASRKIVAEYDGYQAPYGSYFYHMQLAPDNKIYINCGNSENVLHVINQPDLEGVACDVEQHAIQLPVYNIRSIPNYPNYRLGPLDGSPCDTLNINNNPIPNFRYENWDTLNPLHIEFADLSYYEPAEWLWEFENLGTSRDTNPEFTFPSPGIYEVCLTVSNVNSSNRTCKNVPVGQISDVEEAWEKGEPIVFPNPTSNAFQIYNPTSQVIDIQLFNVSGQRVFEKINTLNGEQIDVSFLPEGIYFYSFLNEENQLVKSGKLIISR